MTCYTRHIEAPKDKAEGLQNFVQMIINRLDAGDHREALLLAVDLHEDLRCGIYAEVTAPEIMKTVPVSEHYAAVHAAKQAGIEQGMEAGRKEVRASLRNLLGEVSA